MKTLDRAAILAVVIGAFGLRAFGLGAQELRGDEAFGYFFIDQPYAKIVGDTLALEEPHPVLSYFLQKSWVSVAGISEVSLRTLGMLFSVLAVALLFRLALETKLPVRIGIVGAALLAASPYAVWHSQDARMYSMSMALTLGSTLCAVLWLRRERTLTGIAYVVVSLVALHTHYFTAFIILAQNLYVLVLFVGKRLTGRQFWRWVLWQGALWVLYAPWLLAVREILTDYGGNGDSPGFVEAFSRAFAVFASGETVPVWQAPIWAWLGVAAAALGFVALFVTPRLRPASFLYGLYLVVPVLAAWYGAQARPIFDERYLAAAAPPFFMLVAASLLPLRRKVKDAPSVGLARIWGIGGSLVVIALFVGSGMSLARYHADPAYSKSRGWRELAQSLETLSACIPADSVRLAQNYPDPTLWYYFGNEPEHLVLPPLANDAVLASAEVGALVEEGVERVLFIGQPAASWDANGIAETALHTEYSLAASDTTDNWPIKVYVRSRGISGGQPVHFENGATLAAHHVASGYAPPGGVSVVTLGWDLDDAISEESLKVFVQLLDEHGKIVGQEDRLLQQAPTEGNAALVTDSYGILVPQALPSGEFRLIAGLYRPETAERILTADGVDHIELGGVSLWVGDPADCPVSQQESTSND